MYIYIYVYIYIYIYMYIYIYICIYIVVVVVVVRAPSTCRREKLPDTLSLGRAQGSSRPASRWPGVCRQRPREGGDRHLSGGEGGARLCGGSTCSCDPYSLPRRGGKVCAPVRDGGGMGGGRERPPVRGPAGPRFPCFLAATPPQQGRGPLPVRRWCKGRWGWGLCMYVRRRRGPSPTAVKGAQPNGGDWGMASRWRQGPSPEAAKGALRHGGNRGPAPRRQ